MSRYTEADDGPSDAERERVYGVIRENGRTKRAVAAKQRLSFVPLARLPDDQIMQHLAEMEDTPMSCEDLMRELLANQAYLPTTPFMHTLRVALRNMHRDELAKLSMHLCLLLSMHQSTK